MVHCHRRHSSSTLSHLNRERERDTAIDEHKHMRGENMHEPRKPRDYKDQLLAYVVGLHIP